MLSQMPMVQGRTLRPKTNKLAMATGQATRSD